MIKDAINRLLELAEPQIIDVEGRQYASKGIIPIHRPGPSPLKLDTLTGLKDYLEANRDELDKEGLMLHVSDFGSVNLLSSLGERWNDRSVYAQANAYQNPFRFGFWIEHEEFMIQLQCMFVQDERMAAVLSTIGNIVDENIQNNSDDGVTQKVTVRTGVSMVSSVSIVNPVTLRPFRTFLEIEQPASPFVLRMRSSKPEGVYCALFEADGGQWKNEAMMSIKKWLRDNVPSVTVVA